MSTIRVRDSYELRKSGAAQTLVTSKHRWALMVERPKEREPTLDEALLELDQSALDLIMVEGFKHEPFPKIELHRPAMGRPLLFPTDPSIVAIASDEPIGRETRPPIDEHERSQRNCGVHRGPRHPAPTKAPLPVRNKQAEGLINDRNPTVT